MKKATHFFILPSSLLIKGGGVLGGPWEYWGRRPAAEGWPEKGYQLFIPVDQHPLGLPGVHSLIPYPVIIPILKMENLRVPTGSD